ncbi:MAG: hypothetical protein KME25_32360 [Symplocastrum torsivum CPER-KK1]|jgi:hypothetical protein|uniref:HNH nuclease domain-containing protein n=1 Tax=Symplocastrum torsivum CPER-KK1 TaxID=450513 RepID=A0A951PSQ4_9CYAN|nr:hypothetical protein [Symplocastrum torsivum CPER-KK1]
MQPDTIISTILKHDKKVTSYKFALLRAINDVALNFPDLRNFGQDVAVPLKVLAQFWVAYYWPFADANNPIIQRRGGGSIAFHLELTELRSLWQQELKTISEPSDGFLLSNELRIPRRRALYSPQLLSIYQDVLEKIEKAMVNGPICHAGPGRNKVFKKPKKYSELGDSVVTIPGTEPKDKCLIIQADLWQAFQKMSLWIEALCIHEWCLFSETVEQEDGQGADRGLIYRLLTDRPDNRRPLTWERNHVDVLLMEGRAFICPWTEKRIVQGIEYALDHLLPVSLYPINELWNLIPAEPKFNSHTKRDRLPSLENLRQAQPHLELAYRHYSSSNLLLVALQEDVEVRFSTVSPSTVSFPLDLASAVVDLIDIVAESRNLARF